MTLGLSTYVTRLNPIFAPSTFNNTLPTLDRAIRADVGTSLDYCSLKIVAADYQMIAGNDLWWDLYANLVYGCLHMNMTVIEVLVLLVPLPYIRVVSCKNGH